MLHLGEVGFAWCLVTVAADLSEAGVSSQPLHQVFDVGDLLELAEEEGSEVPLGVVLYGSAGAFSVEACPEDGLDRG